MRDGITLMILVVAVFLTASEIGVSVVLMASAVLLQYDKIEAEIKKNSR